MAVFYWSLLVWLQHCWLCSGTRENEPHCTKSGDFIYSQGLYVLAEDLKYIPVLSIPTRIKNSKSMLH